FPSIPLPLCPPSHLPPSSRPSQLTSLPAHVPPRSRPSQITSIPDHVHPRSRPSQTTSISDHVYSAPRSALRPSSVTSVQHIQHQHVCIATSHLVCHNTSTQRLFSISTSSTMASVFCLCQMCLMRRRV